MFASVYELKRGTRVLIHHTQEAPWTFLSCMDSRGRETTDVFFLDDVGKVQMATVWWTLSEQVGRIRGEDYSHHFPKGQYKLA
jgi:hypothetical protein